MADDIPQFETEERVGTTDPYTGNVGTSWTAIPSVAGTEIQSFTVVNDVDNDITDWIEISLDAGTTVMDRIYPSGSLSHLIKGAKTQIHIRAAAASVGYKVILNRELN